MKNIKSKIAVGIILLVSIGVMVALNLFHQPHIDVKTSDAGIVISTQDILNDYQEDESLANNKYADQIIQIKGVISDISIEDGSSIIIFKDENGLSSVMCHMSPEENLKVLKLKRDKQITVKGICTGYLLDMIMVRCIIVNQ